MRLYRNVINVPQGATNVSQVPWTLGGGGVNQLLTADDVLSLNQFGFHQLVYVVFTLYGNFNLADGFVQDYGTLSISSQDGSGVLATQALQVSKVANSKLATARSVNDGKSLSVIFKPRQTQEATLMALANFLALNFGRVVLTTSDATASTREYRLGVVAKIVSKMDE